MYAADGSISSISSIGHHYSTLTQKTFDTNGTWSLDILTEVVFGCATFNSPMHDNREVVLAVGGYEQSHCSSPRLFPTQIPAWTTSNYYSFIWLFYLTVLHYSWNSTTFCLKTMLSFILHPRDWCVILQSHKHRHIDRYVIQRFHGFANISRIKQECLNPPYISHLGWYLRSLRHHF